MGFRTENGGRGCAILIPNKLVHPFGGSYVCAHFGENRPRNATARVLAHTQTQADFISERELKFMFAICRRPSVCRLSVTFVRPTQTIEIFGNVSTPSGTLAIHDLSINILRRSSQGNPSVGGVKHKRGSQI